MLIGLGSYIFRYAIGNKNYRHQFMLTPMDVVNKSAELGAQVLQFADNLPLNHLRTYELKQLKERADQLQIKLEAGMAGLTIDRLLENLRIAQTLETDLLRVATHYQEISPSQDEIIEILHDVLPEFKAAGISIAIENHFTIASKDLVTIIEKIDSPLVGVCLDTANSIAQQEWPRETTEILAPYARSLHLKDFTLRMQSDGLGVDVRGKPLEVNDPDIAFHIKTVKTHAPGANIILEQWMPAEETVEETLQKEENWISQNIQNVKSYVK